MRQSEIKQFTACLGKRSYKARVERLGPEPIQNIGLQNGKTGDRSKGSGNK